MVTWINPLIFGFMSNLSRPESTGDSNAVREARPPNRRVRFRVKNEAR